MKEGEDISFDQSLFELSLTEENYVLAVSSSLHATAVFEKKCKWIEDKQSQSCLS